MIKQALVLAAAVLLTPAWALNKCVGADGSVSYQERPCAESAKQQKLEIPAGRVTPPDTPYGAHLSDRIKQAEKLCNETDLPRRPQIGWSEEKFLKCSRIGVVTAADAINVTETARGTSKQYVYRDANVYVYTTNGVVTAVQKFN